MPKAVFSDAYASMLSALVTLRREKGVTQVELARRLGKPQPFISYFERGERRIDVIEFYAIVRALESDPAVVFRAITDRLPLRIDI